jgi:hypothetical protein
MGRIARGVRVLRNERGDCVFLNGVKGLIFYFSVGGGCAAGDNLRTGFSALRRLKRRKEWLGEVGKTCVDEVGLEGSSNQTVFVLHFAFLALLLIRVASLLLRGYYCGSG